MRKISIQRFSILGLILMGFSVVTASILPSKNKSSLNRFDQRGSLTESSDNIGNVTCKATVLINDNACNDTAVPPSGTTGVKDGSLSNNTSISNSNCPISNIL